MRKLEAIDATPNKRIYTSIIADYDIEKALCELIDNVLDNGKNNDLKKVNVSIELEKGSQSIMIEDDSGGVHDLKNLISPGGYGKRSKERTHWNVWSGHKKIYGRIGKDNRNKNKNTR